MSTVEVEFIVAQAQGLGDVSDVRRLDGLRNVNIRGNRVLDLQQLGVRATHRVWLKLRLLDELPAELGRLASARAPGQAGEGAGEMYNNDEYRCRGLARRVINDEQYKWRDAFSVEKIMTYCVVKHFTMFATVGGDATRPVQVE